MGINFASGWVVHFRKNDWYTLMRIYKVIREERHLAHLTQQQLAEKTGTKKSFISRIENGHSDIQLSTLYRLLEIGLGRKLSFTIA